jgi:hypothetical protein
MAGVLFEGLSPQETKSKNIFEFGESLDLSLNFRFFFAKVEFLFTASKKY